MQTTGCSRCFSKVPCFGSLCLLSRKLGGGNADVLELPTYTVWCYHKVTYCTLALVTRNPAEREFSVRLFPDRLLLALLLFTTCSVYYHNFRILLPFEDHYAAMEHEYPCPVCSQDLGSLSEVKRTRHVEACLNVGQDGEGLHTHPAQENELPPCTTSSPQPKPQPPEYMQCSCMVAFFIQLWKFRRMHHGNCLFQASTELHAVGMFCSRSSV